MSFFRFEIHRKSFSKENINFDILECFVMLHDSLTGHSLTERSQSQISKQHNEMEFFRMTF